MKRSMTIGALAVSGLMLGGAMLATASPDHHGSKQATSMSAKGDIVDTAVAAGSFKTLAAALKAADLVDALKGKGPFTVFAPTDEAFAALPDGTVETLLKPENKDQLAKILTCHVVAAKAMSDAISKMVADDNGMHPVKTVGGCEFTAMQKDGKIMIKDGKGNVATVTIADVEQSNGVIHVIDTVLLPAS